ncbi:hypothetical protein F9802_09215 [Bacillus aerolatus]|uniref:Polyhydroxyalkanoic acid inclusion protein PhaP n=1 Tax=Bacillus aerolatus TaxID=2653354 RepID=A0A6I1FKC9_9BACI|nr:hypothetical protein [Bacillus aerolatus]KAB7707176.1 hypothetical protein F9802_09215 [Bacillus aerolatus]
METKKDAVYASDLILDGWLNGLNALCSLQEEMEKQPLQAFESQKEWIHSIRGQLSQLEDQSKTMTTEWIATVQETVNKTQKELGGKNDLKWPAQLEEIGHKTQTLAFSPSKKSLELLLRSQAQLETACKQTLDQQQQNRSEYLQVFEGLVDQVKQTQKEVLKPFDLTVK